MASPEKARHLGHRPNSCTLPLKAIWIWVEYLSSSRSQFLHLEKELLLMILNIPSSYESPCHKDCIFLFMFLPEVRDYVGVSSISMKIP